MFHTERFYRCHSPSPVKLMFCVALGLLQNETQKWNFIELHLGDTQGVVVSLLISQVLHLVDGILGRVRFKKKEKHEEKTKQPWSNFILLLITFQYIPAESNLAEDMGQNCHWMGNVISYWCLRHTVRFKLNISLKLSFSGSNSLVLANYFISCFTVMSLAATLIYLVSSF